MPGLPIIHFNPRQVLVLSPPSIATTRHKNQVEEKRRLEGERGIESIEDGDNVIGASGSGIPISVKGDVTRAGGGRKKVKGPNPLSVKRKKAEKRPRDDQDQDQDPDQDGNDVVTRAKTGEKGDSDVEDDAGGKRRKKRKRGRGKGAVAEARAELEAELQAPPRSSKGLDNGGVSASGSGDDE